MEKIILTTLLAIFLLAPQAGIQAAGDQQSLHGKPFREFDERISNINRRVEALELQLGELPPDLAESLKFLQLTVDDNSSDISMNYDAITIIMMEIESILDRLTALEKSGEPPDAEKLVYSGHFIMRDTPAKDSQLVRDWLEFRRNATERFTSIEIRGSAGAGVSCSDPETATAIANALSSGRTDTFKCENRLWNVGTAGIGGIELNAGSIEGTDTCSEEASVRPLNGNSNWGGIGFTCVAPSQTLEVILTR